MGKPVSRVGDMHVCPAVNPGPVPHVGGPITSGSPNVFTNSIPTARVSDSALCVGPPTSDSVSAGSAGVFVNGLPIARQSDSCAHGGKITIGSGNVFAGEKESPPVHPKPVIRKGKHSQGAADSASEQSASSVESGSAASSAPTQSNISLPPRIRNKKVSPASLGEAAAILEERRAQIATEGYQPKYSDAELQKIAKSGNIGGDRFQARFMEERYLNDRDTPDEPLSGKMGMPMKEAVSQGAKYWSTSFDQIEDADTDPKLIAEKLGLTYKPEANYCLLIVDTDLTTPLTGAKSVSATFENLSEFANTELPKKFSKSFTAQVMNPEFQAQYSELYKAAENAGTFEGKDNWNSDSFENFLKLENVSTSKIDLMKLRFDMHGSIGNNDDYLGNGLTKNNNSSIDQQYGVVETINIERNKINLAQLDEINAIKIILGLKII